ncbi:portal protein [Acinetobacter pecorum]|uniref:Head-tail connector protein n=1 Tax=Acinetobacter pecorum TaxID=2762215 RepID=A0ABR8VZT5_9GAMM|nr:portal protein [Acinetobacter pecorum]MBD8010258.1 head-tail connector protein [Acinetobacter pecorum]
MVDSVQILKRLSQLKSDRIKHEAHWKECYKYCAPERQQSFTDVSALALETERKQARTDLYDTTAVEGIQLLVSSIVSGTTSPVSLWFKSIPSGVDTPSQLTQGEQWLNLVDNFIFRNIHSSNFDSEVTDFLTDLVVAGWAVLFADTNREKGGFTFNTWSIGNCYISSTQASGLIDTIYREFELSAEQIVSEFGIDNVSDKVKTALDKKPDQKFILVQAIFPRDKKLVKGEAGQRVSTAMPFASYTIEAQSKHILKESGYEEFPCIVSRFKKIPDSHYGLGMGSMVISDCKTTNQLMKLSLQTAELNLGGLWISQHDGVINPNTLRIRPNAIIAANSVDAIKRLDTGSANVGMGLDFLQHFQAKIKRTLMSDQLTPQGSSPLTATEIQARVNVYRNQLGAIFSRMQSEYLQTLLERVWGLSMRSGMLPPAPEELMQASRISFNFLNPMASSQKLSWVTSIQELMLNVGQMAQIDPTVMDNLNMDAMVQICADALAVPTEAIRTDEEIAELRQAKQEQQQAMQEQQQQQALMSQVGQTGLDIAKDQARNMTPEQLGEMFAQ